MCDAAPVDSPVDSIPEAPITSPDVGNISSDNHQRYSAMSSTVAASGTDAPVSPAEELGTVASAVPVEQRLLTGKEKIDAQNRERIEKEKEETKKREMERRKLGQVS